MERKAGKKRKHYLNDFNQAVNGEYIYTGTCYRPQMDSSRFSTLRVRIIAVSILSAAFVLAAGLLPAAGSLNCFYVILPFLAVIICCFVKAGKLARLFFTGDTVREYIFLKTVPEIPGWTIAETVASAITLIAETVYLIMNGFENREIYTIVFGFVIAAIVPLDIISLKLFRSIIWHGPVSE